MCDINGEGPRPSEASPEVGEESPEQDELGLALRMSEKTTEAMRLERLRKEEE